MQEPNKPDIVTREGFATAAAPLERLLLTAGYGVLRDWDAAADAVQSALLKAWRGRRSVKDAAKFKAWLVKIVVNESRDIVRRGFAAELKEAAAEQPSDPDVRIDVRRAVDGLSDRYRLPVMLFYYEDMTVSDIAAALKLPYGTVISLLHRGREQLKKELKDYGR